MNSKLEILEEYVRNIAQQEILKDKIKAREMDIAFNKMQNEMEKLLKKELFKC